MVLLAFSLQDQVEKYGAYVGVAAFFGLALLSLLYFAQAREVKRLRDWAGRAPERAAELEAMAIDHAEEARRKPAPAPPQPAAVPPVQRITAPAAPANGSVELEPAQVAALAFARAAGVRTPHPPRPHPAPVAAAPAEAPPTEVAGAGAATAAGDATAVADVATGNGHGSGGVPAPATPAARRAEAPPAETPSEPEPEPEPAGASPRPAAPLRQTPPPRRPAPPRRATAAGPPPRRESSARAIVFTALIGVVVLAVTAFAVIKLTGGGGGGHKPPPQPKVVNQSPTGTATSTPIAQATPALTKATTHVEVYNATTTPNLAGSVRDQLNTFGYNSANLDAATYTPNQQRQSSTVMYQRGDKPAAAAVAQSLGISDVRLIDTTTQQLLQQSGSKADVVVIVGADKSQ